MASLAVTTVDRRAEYQARLAEAHSQILDPQARDQERQAFYRRARRGGLVLRRLVRHFRQQEQQRRQPRVLVVHNPDSYLEGRA